ncbi:MAG TPA: DoxX family protein [Holophagaceae bacterium]|nr:DoxX family protein [Holophagaceae bacterium]
MKLFKGLITKETAGLDLLRLALCAILFTHGAHRLISGEAPGLGGILADLKFPFPVTLAYLVCAAETGGSLLIALRILVAPAGAVLISIYATGIFLFHRHHGFFVVGPGEGGWEYSALLITCLGATMWANWRNRWLPARAARATS